MIDSKSEPFSALRAHKIIRLQFQTFTDFTVITINTNKNSVNNGTKINFVNNRIIHCFTTTMWCKTIIKIINYLFEYHMNSGNNTKNSYT